MGPYKKMARQSTLCLHTSRWNLVIANMVMRQFSVYKQR